MKSGFILIAAVLMMGAITAGAAGSAESRPLPQKPAPSPQPAREREPAPPPSLSLSGGIDAMLACDRRIGAALDAAATFGHFGIALGGDVVSLNMTQEADAHAIGALGFVSLRYYGRATSLTGNYLLACFAGAGVGYGVVGNEAESQYTYESYVELAPALPFGAELGVQTVFANQLLVQSLVRLGGIYIMGNDVHGVYPLVSVTLSVGMFIE